MYEVRQYVDGLPWSQFIAENVLVQSQRFTIREKLINTIHAFHEKQLPHGDLEKLLVQVGAE